MRNRMKQERNSNNFICKKRLLLFFDETLLDAPFLEELFLEVDLRPPLLDFLEADFLEELFFDADLDLPDLLAFLGTLAPDFLASDKPIAIACFREVTFLPLRPLFSFPRFSSCNALLTFLPAPFEYFAILLVFGC